MTIAPQFLEQMQQCLRNVNTALEAVGGSLNDVVSLRIYLVNYDPDTEGNVIAEVLKDFFLGDRRPATTWIGVSSLAVKDFLIEIEATAVLEPTSSSPTDEAHLKSSSKQNEMEK